MKRSTVLITSVLALSLSACGATTGGVTKSLAKQAAISTISQQIQNQENMATLTEPAPATVQPVEADKKCVTLAAQIAETDEIIAQATTTIDGAGGANIAGQAAAAGASQLALQNGAAGALAKVPFGGLFARSAMNSIANSGKKKVEKAQKSLNKAKLRKARLSGLYAGKNCAS